MLTTQIIRLTSAYAIMLCLVLQGCKDCADLTILSGCSVHCLVDSGDWINVYWMNGTTELNKNHWGPDKWDILPWIPQCTFVFIHGCSASPWHNDGAEAVDWTGDRKKERDELGVDEEYLVSVDYQSFLYIIHALGFIENPNWVKILRSLWTKKTMETGKTVLNCSFSSLSQHWLWAGFITCFTVGKQDCVSKMKQVPG